VRGDDSECVLCITSPSHVYYSRQRHPNSLILPPSPSLTRTRTLSLSLSLSLPLTHTQTHSHIHTLSLTHTYTHCLTYTHTLSHHSDRRSAVIRELLRVTRPGGFVLIHAWAKEQGEDSKHNFPDSVSATVFVCVWCVVSVSLCGCAFAGGAALSLLPSVLPVAICHHVSPSLHSRLSAVRCCAIRIHSIVHVCPSTLPTNGT
jgi:SAM-dependent methyltransferase